MSDAAAAAFVAEWEPRLRDRGLALDGRPLEEPDDDDILLLFDPPDEPDAADEAPGPRRQYEGKASDVLVQIAVAEAELFHSPDGTEYARLFVADHHEVWPLKSSGFRKWLTRRYYEAQHTNPSGNALTEAALTISGIASHDGPEHPVNLRVARFGDSLYVDLANDAWDVVETADRERERLANRLARLSDMFGWGDLAEPDYRRQVSEVRAQLASIPSPDGRMVTFDDYRRRAAEMRSFAEMVDSASGDKLQELVPWLIARVETANKAVVRIVPTEPARPFFAWAEQEREGQGCVGVAPPDGFEPPTPALGRPRSIH
jgi:hypothetical protein